MYVAFLRPNKLTIWLGLFFCSFFASIPLPLKGEPPFTTHTLRKESHAQLLLRIRQEALLEQWETLLPLLAHALSQKHPLSFAEIASLAHSLPDTPLAYAVTATQNIMALNGETGLSLKVVLPIALFAETLLQKRVLAGEYFFRKDLYGRELEYDPDRQRFFIHLGTDHVAPLGKGKKKVVTKTVLYDRDAPQILARGVTLFDVTTEIFAMESLQGAVGVIQAEGILIHKQGKKTITSIVTRIYNKKSLQPFIESCGSSLSLKERIHIAYDLITGLASMHERSFVHRDLGAKNFFVHVTEKSHAPREINAIVADLGRALPISEVDGTPVQGNSMYLSPEGFFQSKMKGADYYKSDIFALGCVFWQLYFGEMPRWSRAKFFRKDSWSLKKRYRAHLALLKKTRRPFLSKRNASPKGKFLSLILQMTDPNPKARGTAQSLKKEFSQLLIK